MDGVPVLFGPRARPGNGDPPAVLLRGDPGDYVHAPSGGEPMLVLRRAAEVRACLRHPRVIMAPTGARGCPLTGAELQDADGGLLRMDPPALPGIRRSIAGLLASGAADVPAVTRIAGRLAAGLDDGTDLRAGYAEPSTAAAVCAALGRPPGDWEFIHAVSREAFRVVPPGGTETARAAWASLYAYYERDGREPAAAGLVRRITLAMRRDGYAAETITRTLATVSNGFPAVYPVLARCLAELLQRPATVARCAAGELDWCATVDGLMKTGALFPFGLPRLALDGITLAGRHIPAGTVMLPSLAGAGRDGAPASIAFGAGPHFCPGAAWSRLWIATAVRVFFAAYPHARLAGRLEWDGGTLPVPRVIPVVLR
jgi:biflaviolin synthase